MLIDMTKIDKKMISLIASGTIVLASAPAVQAMAATDDTAGVTDQTMAADAATSAISDAAQSPSSIKNIQGTFTWNQSASMDNPMLARTLYQSSRYLCGAQGNQLDGAALTSATTAESAPTSSIETIEVKGDVGNAFTATISDYEKKAPVMRTFACTCKGNPADGRASANVEVKGFKLSALLRDADPADDVNTITFTSSDGYSVSLPLSYVMQRYSIIVTSANGEDMSDALGCSNQLWLGSTSARSFVKDVVSIELTCEANPPAAPGMSEDANQPNVGVVSGAFES